MNNTDVVVHVAVGVSAAGRFRLIPIIGGPFVGYVTVFKRAHYFVFQCDFADGRTVWYDEALNITEGPMPEDKVCSYVLEDDYYSRILKTIKKIEQTRC